jgi:hypothetical protein
MKDVDRRSFLPILALSGSLAAQPAAMSIRGKLIRTPDSKPALDVPRRGLIPLDGDGPTLGVLKDPRLSGVELEALGRFKAEKLFEIGPIHTRSMFVHRDGRRLFISYWCELCSIRTYTPGICWCCQQDTALDLREKDPS